jgi:hypothetical protein
MTNATILYGNLDLIRRQRTGIESIGLQGLSGLE